MKVKPLFTVYSLYTSVLLRVLHGSSSGACATLPWTHTTPLSHFLLVVLLLPAEKI